MEILDKNDSSPIVPNTIPSIWRLISHREQIIVPLNAGGKGASIYFVHSIGGDLTGYDRLVTALGSTQRIFGLQVPKTMMVAGTATSIEDMASRYATALMRFQPEGPLVIAGYSAGAVIALELAQQLKLQGREVPLLVAFDGAPSNTSAGAKPWQAVYLWQLACNIPRRLVSVRVRDFKLANLKMRLAFKRSTKQQSMPSNHRALEWDAVSKVVERSGWPKEQQLFIRRTYQAMVSYVPRAYPGAVILYEVKAQPFLQLAQFGAVWRHLARSCEIVSVNARHSDFFESRSGLRRVADHLREALRRLDETSDRPATAVAPTAYREQPAGRLQCGGSELTLGVNAVKHIRRSVFALYALCSRDLESIVNTAMVPRIDSRA